MEDCDQATERYEDRDNRRLVRAVLLLIRGEYHQAIACITPRKKQDESLSGMGGLPSMGGMAGMGGMPEPPTAATSMPPMKPDSLRELLFPPPSPPPFSGSGSPKP